MLSSLLLSVLSLQSCLLGGDDQQRAGDIPGYHESAKCLSFCFVLHFTHLQKWAKAAFCIEEYFNLER